MLWHPLRGVCRNLRREHTPATPALQPRGPPPNTAALPHLSTPLSSPAPSISLAPVIKQEDTELSGVPTSPRRVQTVAVKQEPTEPANPGFPPSSPSLTNSGSYRVRSLPQPGQDRVTWAQAQFMIFKSAAEVPIRLARKPKFL